MMIIEFYEKPGCAGNARQKEKLQKLGCMLSVKNMLSTNWDKQDLLEYFGDKAVSEWFNMSAPSIKDGIVKINGINKDEALELMMKEPILIKRPLMKCGNVKLSGFDPKEIQEKLGLNVEEAPPTCTAHDNCNKN